MLQVKVNNPLYGLSLYYRTDPGLGIRYALIQVFKFFFRLDLTAVTVLEATNIILILSDPR